MLLYPIVLIVFLFFALLGILRFVRSRFTRYTISGGWIRVRKGIIFRSELSIEILHIKNVMFSQGPLDRLTGNGQLRITTEHHSPVTLKGFAHADILQQMRTDLLVLARLLRGHRGILN